MRNTYAQSIWTLRRNTLLAAARHCEVNGITSGYYFEFGCHGARTFRIAYDAFSPLHDFTYVAFDSFEGLPDVTGVDVHGDLWYRGQMCTSEEDFRRLCKRHRIPEEKYRIVKGFYDSTLTPELAAKLGPQHAAVIYIDCDLYASTVPVLSFIKSFLRPGTLIVFDDWFLYNGDPERGERKAFAEFQLANPGLRFQRFLSNNEHQAFIFLGETPQLPSTTSPQPAS
ncbi:TylF/MycF/NovP-related O-methyltransferase [Streptomyces sp. NPDC001339]|uniref:TylF/MycF/NovP-related O-methyltransferase n=1 Tax=Streptomyces sp. NPDC001339 TaxID=3364563 RepID=UPI0036909A3E